VSDFREASLESGPREHLPLAAQLGPFAVLAAGAIWLASSWARLPARIPIHWNWRGQPDGWVARSPAGAALPLLLGAAVCGLLIAMQLGIRRGAPRSAMRAPILKLLLGGEYFVALVCCGALGVSVSAGRLLWPMLAITFAGVVALLAFTARAVRNVARDPQRNPAAWRGLFYVDRDDPALFVPKKYGVGYTFNFGHPGAVALTVAFLVLPLLAVLFAISAR
jgi:uncharacterized membrane protein